MREVLRGGQRALGIPKPAWARMAHLAAGIPLCTWHRSARLARPWFSLLRGDAEGRLQGREGPAADEANSACCRSQLLPSQLLGHGHDTARLARAGLAGACRPEGRGVNISPGSRRPSPLPGVRGLAQERYPAGETPLGGDHRPRELAGRAQCAALQRAEPRLHTGMDRLFIVVLIKALGLRTLCSWRSGEAADLPAGPELRHGEGRAGTQARSPQA